MTNQQPTTTLSVRLRRQDYLLRFSLISLLLLVFAQVASANPSDQPSIDVSQFSEIKRFGRGTVTGMAVDPNGEVLVVTSATGVWFYRLDTFELVQSSPTSATAPVWSPSGNLLALAGNEGTLRVRGLDEALPETVFAMEPEWIISALAWSPDSRWIAASYSNYSLDTTDSDQIYTRGRIRVWDVETQATVMDIPELPRLVGKVAWSPDGTRLAALLVQYRENGDSSLQMWDGTGKSLFTVDHIGSYANGLVWSADGNDLVILVSGDGAIQIRNASDGDLINSLSTGQSFAATMEWSPDQTRLAVGGEGGSLQIWDLAADTLTASLYGHTGNINYLAWTPDGSQLVSAGADSTIRRWEVATTQLLSMLEEHTGPVTSVAWSPDGRRLASGNDDASAHVWDLQASEEIIQFEAHEGNVSSVTWSPDGTRIASASGYFSSPDDTLRIWDATTGEQRAVMSGLHIEQL